MEDLWPSEVRLQGLASNRPERHWLKTVVVSVGRKGGSMWPVRYESRRRAQANHRSGVEIAFDDIKTRGRKYLWEEPIGNPAYWVGGVRRRGGVISIRARLWNCGNSERDAKGDGQAKQSKALSTDARTEDGPTRSSVEASVMGAERRGRVVPVEACVNFFGRMSA